MAITADKKKRRLLLLTRRFPFNRGEVAAESYLENEIGVLSTYFDEVLAVGTEAQPGDAPTCALPGNVTPLALGCGNTSKDKALLAVKGIAFPLLGGADVREAYATESVHGIGKRVFRGYFAARAKAKADVLAEELVRFGFEPTHIYSFWLYDTALVAAWLTGTYPCARAVARAHGYDLYADRTDVHYLPFRGYLLSKLSGVLPCSKDGEEYINANWPGHEGKVTTSYLGTREMPDKSGEPLTCPLRVVSCSRIVDVKRVPLLAKAVTLLDAEGLRVEWTHYGDGPQLEEARAACSLLTHSTAKFAGALPNDALLGEYTAKHFDVFVNVSSSEGLPLSIMEACGFGIPVIATDVGGTHEIVSDGVNGFLLPSDCGPEDVAAAIKRFVFLGKAEGSSMRRAARAVWERDFRLEANVEGLVRSLGVDYRNEGE